MIRLAPAILLLAVAGCGPLVQIGAGTPPPDSLMTLSLERPPMATQVASAEVAVERAVSVAPPAVPAAVQTLRVPVRVDATSFQYVVGAQWSEQPARLFQQLLAEELRARGEAVLDPGASGVAGGRRLSGRLEEFGVDTTGAAPVVRVRYEAVLAAPAGLRQGRFVREVPLAAIEASQVASALNRAANMVARDVGDWLAGRAPAAAGGGGGT